jgi:lipopolysaccharide biosynthesis glycosyltransferase
MNIVYAGDKNYFPHIGVSITSLIAYNKVDTVYLLTDIKNAEDAGELAEYVKEWGVNFQVLVVDLLRLRLKVSKKITLAAYYRLLLPNLLLDDRAIYLDGDTIINGSLDALWNMDFGNSLIAAVEDISVSKSLKFKLFGKDISYFNSGVLSLDLKTFRENRLTERMLDFAQQHKEKITYHDQCVLNYFLQDKWIKLPAKYNLMASHLLNPEKYSTEMSAPVVVHYNSYYGKPWDYYCIHPMKDLYFEARKHTPWESCQLTKNDWLSYYRRKFAVINKTLVLLRGILNKIG